MSVPRTVKFWQITDGLGEPLRGTFPAGALMRRLRNSGVEGSRHEADDGWVLMAQSLRRTEPQHMALYRIRRENLPAIEQRGRFSDLRLAEDQNLAEATHFRFFPRNVVGQLYNHDGPHVSRLASYLWDMFDVGVEFAPVLQRDAARRLSRMREPSAIEVAIPVDQGYLLDEAGTELETIQALRDLVDVSGARTVYVKFALWGSRTPNAPSRWRTAVSRIIGSRAVDAFNHLKVRAWDVDVNARRTVDLISEQLALEIEVELTSDIGRAVRNNSARAGLEEAYDALEGEINASVPRVQLPDRSLTLDDLAPEGE